MEGLTLHAIIIHKPFALHLAKEMVEHITQTTKKHFMRETAHSYRFRIIPKTKFNSFVSKPINEKLTLVFGHLK
jgi:hypothetical protein